MQVMRTDTRSAEEFLREKMKELINQLSDKILENWFERLKEEWGNNAVKRLNAHKGAMQKSEDLFSLLQRQLQSESDPEVRESDVLLHILRTSEYSIVDLFTDMSALEKAIETALRSCEKLETGELFDGLALISGKLHQLFERLLRETSEVYEYIIESGGRGFCHLNKEGQILAANKKMRELLNIDSPLALPFDSFFRDHEHAFIDQMIANIDKEKPTIRPMHVMGRNAKEPIPVMLEMAPITIGSRSRGMYACMTDIRRPSKAMETLLDRSNLGILSADLHGQITYANKAVLRTLGTDSWKGKTVEDFVGNPEALSTVQLQSGRRRQGLSDEYDIEISRMSDGKRMPVKISAFPETDLEGNVTGTMAIIRNMEKETAIQALHSHIEEERDWNELLKKVAYETQKLVPYDFCFFTLYSEDMSHSRELTRFPKLGQLKSVRRWWKMSTVDQNFIQQKTITSGNIDEFLSQEKWKHLLLDKEFQYFISTTKAKSFIFYPIVRDRVLASISFFSREENKFDKSHEKLLRELPLDTSVLMTLYYQQREDLAFRLNLLKALSSASNNIKEVGDVIVKEIGNQYKWDNVSLFRVDEYRKKIVLESQYYRKESFRIKDKYEQSVETGVLGRVLERGEAVCIPDVDTDGEFRNVCVKAFGAVRSEICIPVSIMGNVRWLLNVEDTHQNGFSKEDRDTLETIATELAGSMERARLQFFFQQTLGAASDAVIITDVKGNVIKANRACAKLLGYPVNEIEGKDLRHFFVNAGDADYFMGSKSLPNKRVRLFGRDRIQVDVLLSVSELPEELGGKVLIAKDPSVSEREEELEYLGKMYYELASQMKTPLSLIFTWLHQLKKDKPENANDTIDKILKQARKLQLTYDRLAFYDKERGAVPYNPILLAIDEVVGKVLEELPDRDRNKILFDREDELLLFLRGDFYQLFFCFQSILSCLLRFLPEEDNIRWKISRDGDELLSEITGYFPGTLDEHTGDAEMDYAISRATSEMAMGRSIIKLFIQNHGGTFFESEVLEDRITFRITLPLQQGD